MTKEELEQIRQLIREENESIKTDMATRRDIQRLEQKVDKGIEAMAEFFHETWAKMDTTNERVTNIEDHLGLLTPHKN